MDPFVAEIRIFPFNFAPKGWAFCNGQLMPISQNTALFSLLGTMYGGDGKSTFGLPDLEGSAPISFGQGPGTSDRVQGEMGGEPSVTLLPSELPSHSHPLGAGTLDRRAEGGLPAHAVRCPEPSLPRALPPRRVPGDPEGRPPGGAALRGSPPREHPDHRHRAPARAPAGRHRHRPDHGAARG